MLAVLFPTASVSMQIAPCQVSTFKHRGTIAFWGPTTPLPFYALNRYGFEHTHIVSDRSQKCSLLTPVSQCTCRLMATGNRLHNVLQKGAGCVRPFSWQHANHCRVSNSNQQTKATMEVAKRQTTGDSLLFAVIASSQAVNLPLNLLSDLSAPIKLSFQY